MSDSLVTVYRALNPADAQLIRSRLDAAGFAAEVAHELSSLSMEGYSLATGGIRVQVRPEDAAEARALIESANAPNDTTADDEP
jgi:hypothetical protein